MDQPADFSLLDAADGPWAKLTGDWTARGLGDAAKRLRAAMADHKDARLDLSDIGRCDTVGAMAILKVAGSRLKPGEGLKGRAETLRLIDLISRVPEQAAAPPHVPMTMMALMERLGRGLVGVGLDTYHTMAFNGRVLAAAGRLIIDPRRMRWAPFVSLAERAGLDAIPIVSLTSFFIGAVVGFLGANMLSQFGAQVFNVELIGIARPARIQHPHHRPAAGRPIGLQLRRRDRLDEDEPGDRRHAGAGRRSRSTPWCCRASWPCCSPSRC